MEYYFNLDELNLGVGYISISPTNWDDYGFRTQFSVEYIEYEGSLRISLGSVSIADLGAEGTDSFTETFNREKNTYNKRYYAKDSLKSISVSDESGRYKIDSLPKTFVSLGVVHDYYSELFKLEQKKKVYLKDFLKFFRDIFLLKESLLKNIVKYQ